MSRTIDFDDYTIHDDVFRMLDCKWGPHTVDRFACSYNAKVSRYNSRFYQPGTEAVDAFTQNWDGELTGFFLRSRKLVELLLMLEHVRP